MRSHILGSATDRYAPLLCSGMMLPGEMLVSSRSVSRCVSRLSVASDGPGTWVVDRL